MPLDPNIILSGLQQQRGVDMNALLQQKISGMENINALERQRKSDELVMQDRAAKAAKEQEAAAIKALLPAYTYGIQTGDIAGAGNLVPPEMRDQLQPFIDALAGKSPQEVQSALIGSLSSSPEGQEALAAIQRAQNYGVQARQAKTSEDRLAFDIEQANKPPAMTPYQEADIALRRQKQALDARGEGEWELKDGIDENGRPIFVWTNPRTRQIVKAEIGAGVPAAAPGVAPGPTPIPAPDVIAPRQSAPGVPEVAPPISTAQPPAEFRPKPKAGELKEQEAKSLDLAAQMTQANKITDELDTKGVRTSDALVSFTEALFASLPDAAGRNLADQIKTAAENLLPSLSADEQRLARAQIQFVDAVLRSRSGAEIKTSEFPSMYRVFFPTEADENIPEIVADKKVARRLAVDTMRAKAGTLGAETLDRILRENGVLPPAATPLTPGATLEGFEYQGVRK